VRGQETICACSNVKSPHLRKQYKPTARRAHYPHRSASGDSLQRWSPISQSNRGCALGLCRMRLRLRERVLNIGVRRSPRTLKAPNWRTILALNSQKSLFAFWRDLGSRAERVSYDLSDSRARPAKRHAATDHGMPHAYVAREPQCRAVQRLRRVCAQACDTRNS